LITGQALVDGGCGCGGAAGAGAGEADDDAALPMIAIAIGGRGREEEEERRRGGRLRVRAFVGESCARAGLECASMVVEGDDLLKSVRERE
jgi:hypothetical protein